MTDTPLTTSDDAAAKADRFLAQLGDVRVDSSSRNRSLAKLGMVLLVAGAIVGWLAVVLSQTTDNPLDQSTDVSLGIAGMTTSLIGLGLYLRYSLAQFLRFWLLRLSLDSDRAS